MLRLLGFEQSFPCLSSEGSSFGLPLGAPVVPFYPFSFWLPLLKPNSRRKGTLIIKGLLGNLVLGVAENDYSQPVVSIDGQQKTLSPSVSWRKERQSTADVTPALGRMAEDKASYGGLKNAYSY